MAILLAFTPHQKTPDFLGLQENCIGLKWVKYKGVAHLIFNFQHICFHTYFLGLLKIWER